MAHFRRRLFLAAAASVILHMGLVCLLRAPESERVRMPGRSVPFELQHLKWIEAAPAAPITPHNDGTASKAVPHARSRQAETASPSLIASHEPDVPRAVRLIPSLPIDSTLGGVPTGVPHGKTLTPADMPTPSELSAKETDTVHSRVDAWAHGLVSQSKVKSGWVNPLEASLGAALRDATAQPPPFIDTSDPGAVTKALASSWAAGAEQFARTGAPYAEPPGRIASLEVPSSIEEAAAQGSPDARAAAQKFYAAARLREFADGRTSPERYALVEVRRSELGAYTVELRQSSGHLAFDDWVLRQTRQTADRFVPDAGATDSSSRSLWRFDARVTYWRKVKLSELNGRAAAAMLGQLLAGPLTGGLMPVTGRFDDVTGQVEVVDLSNPQFSCQVTLVEAE